jgi:hypothetical protein
MSAFKVKLSVSEAVNLFFPILFEYFLMISWIKKSLNVLSKKINIFFGLNIQYFLGY